MTRRRISALRSIALAVLLGACAEKSAPSVANAGTSGAGATAGTQLAGNGGSGANGPLTGGQAAASECTPNLAPTDEFYVPCEDAGRPQVVADAGMPRPDDAIADAGDPPLPDASVLPDASQPDPIDEGPCAMREQSCHVGHGETTIGAATCTINGNGVYVEREICEVCSKDTALMDFGVVIMDCGVCAQVYAEYGFTNGEPINAGECRMRSDALDLSWSAADLGCVDVYSYTGSGIANISGVMLEVSDLVRVCRCDRTTDTCVPCMDGSCDEP